jgi:hypothetical protein
MQRAVSKRLVLANILGSLGYLSLLIEWAWVALLLVYPLVEKGKFSWLIPNTPTVAPPPIEPLVITPPLAIVMSLVVIFCLIATIYALIKLPASVGRTGGRVTHVGAEAVIPKLTGHKKLSRSRMRRLSFRVIFAIKLIFILLPVVATLIFSSVSALPNNVTWAVLAFLVVWPVLYFGLQAAIVSLLKLDPQLAW